MHTYSDDSIMAVIKKLINGEGTDHEIAFWEKNELKDLDVVYDLIYYSKKKLTPEEILKKAREMNKPILL